MKLKLDCIPCMVRHALDVARMVTDDENEQLRLLAGIANLIPKLNRNQTGPEVARTVYRTIASQTGISDPYRKVKDEHIRSALRLYPDLKGLVSTSDDQIYAALMISAIGNIIDPVAVKNIDINPTLLTSSRHKMAICDYEEFRSALTGARTLLLIGDNAGETVFDRLLIETLEGIHVIYAVRESPIINDATLEDAEKSGLCTVAEVISSGCTTPGTLLSECSEQFRSVFAKADVVISKGQGNYETLTDTLARPVFFLLKAKCEIMAQQLGVEVGDLVFVKK